MSPQSNFDEAETLSLSGAGEKLAAAISFRDGLIKSVVDGASVSILDLRTAECAIGEAQTDVSLAKARSLYTKKKAVLAEIATIVAEGTALEAQVRAEIAAAMAKASEVDAALNALKALVSDYNTLNANANATFERCRQFTAHRCDQAARTNATLAAMPRPERPGVSMPHSAPAPLCVDLLDLRAGRRNEGSLIYGQLALRTASELALDAFSRTALGRYVFAEGT